MRCKNCGNEIASHANFCKFCGIRIDKSDPEIKSLNETSQYAGDSASVEAENETSNKNKKITAIALAVFLIVAIVGTVVFMFNRGDGSLSAEPIKHSEQIKKINMDRSCGIKGNRAYLKFPEVIYVTGETEYLEACTVYINEEVCPVKEGYVLLPETFNDDKCNVRLEWEKGEEEYFCETVVNLEEIEEGSFEEVKILLVEKYGESEKIKGDSNYEFFLMYSEELEYIEPDGAEYVHYMSPGIMEFCEIDLDSDGSNEMLCMRQTEEMGFDCMVYDEVDGKAKCIYSFEEADEIIPKGYGGVLVRDGDNPHFTWLNRQTPMNIYYMEDGEIIRFDLGQNYQDFIGGEENYKDVMKIYGEYCLKRELL